MEIRLRRAKNLKRLIDERYDGVASRLARATDIHPTYVSAMLAPLRGKGGRPVTEETATRIEEAIGLEPGELSRDPNAPPAPTKIDRAAEVRNDPERAADLIGSQFRMIGNLTAGFADILGRVQALEAVVMIKVAADGVDDPRRSATLGRALREGALRAGASEGAEESKGAEHFRSLALEISRYALDAPEIPLEDLVDQASEAAARTHALVGL